MSRLYEHKSEAVISGRHFVRRLVRHTGIAIGLIAISLLPGMVGYRYLGRVSWLDAYLNAAMLLGGMGPVDAKDFTSAGKLFAGTYALYAGLVCIVVTGIMVAPVLHRVLHRFHRAGEGDDAASPHRDQTE